MPGPTPTQLLRKEVEKTFFPFVEARGFKAGRANALYRPFLRMRGDEVHWFNIQWEKSHRPYFVLNFSEFSCDAVGYVDGEEVRLLDDFRAIDWLGRVQRRRGGDLSNWFGLRKRLPEALRTFSTKYAPSEVVEDLIRGFEELEQWWDTKVEGPHIYIVHEKRPFAVVNRVP